MARLFLLAAVAALLSVSVSAKYYYTGGRKCYTVGERCAGAKGYERVDGSCCKGLVCAGKHKKYGKVCQKPKKHYGYAPKCYKEGQRCMGAKGYAPVHHAPCCPGLACTGSHYGYGKKCVKFYVKPTYVAPSYPKHYAPKCYKEGERCMGASGFAAVHYAPCCPGLACTGSHYGYGKKCVKVYVKPAYVAPTYHPKCYKLGERCLGAPGKPAVAYLGNDKWDGCCTGYTCAGHGSGYGAWGKYCVAVGVHGHGHHGKKYGYGHHGKKCYKTGERCMGAYGYSPVAYYPCCDPKASCVGSHKDWGKVCAIKY